MGGTVVRFRPRLLSILAIRFEEGFQAFRRVVFERERRRASPRLLHTLREESFLERVPVRLRLSQFFARLKRIVPCQVAARLAVTFFYRKSFSEPFLRTVPRIDSVG
jgi:hypothetical protein